MTPNREPMTLPGIMIWLGLRPTPLRRSFDRWEVAARWAAIITIAAAFVVGPWVSGVVGDQVRDTTAQQRQALHRTTATLVTDTVAFAGLPGDPGARLRATATWTTTDGRRLEGPVNLPTGAEKDDHVEIWLDASGHPTTPPASDFEVSLTALVAGVTSGVVTLLAAVCWLVVVRRLLEGPTERYWEQAWVQFDGLGERPGP
jgi:hypothetical protein